MSTLEDFAPEGSNTYFNWPSEEEHPPITPPDEHTFVTNTPPVDFASESPQPSEGGTIESFVTAWPQPFEEEPLSTTPPPVPPKTQDAFSNTNIGALETVQQTTSTMMEVHSQHPLGYNGFPSADPSASTSRFTNPDYNTSGHNPPTTQESAYTPPPARSPPASPRPSFVGGPRGAKALVSKIIPFTKQPKELPPFRSISRSNEATVVFFGTTGVGKSSVINMLPNAPTAPDAPLAAVSNSSSGVTAQTRSYNKTIGGRDFRIFDTAGMGESSNGTVPMHDAIQRFHAVLTEQGAINLIVFVIRGGRLTKMEENNHRLIKLLCGDNVPIALVVTGLEYEDDIDGWWDKQNPSDRGYAFTVDHHVGVVASLGKHNMLQELYDASKPKVESLLDRAVLPAGHHVEVGDWFPKFVAEVRGVIEDDMRAAQSRIVDPSEQIRKILKKYEKIKNDKPLFRRR